MAKKAPRVSDTKKSVKPGESRTDAVGPPWWFKGRFVFPSALLVLVLLGTVVTQGGNVSFASGLVSLTSQPSEKVAELQRSLEAAELKSQQVQLELSACQRRPDARAYIPDSVWSDDPAVVYRRIGEMQRTLNLYEDDTSLAFTFMSNEIEGGFLRVGGEISSGSNYAVRCRVLARCMQALGYIRDASSITGPELLEEVRQYQQAHGLKVDGVVGTETWRKMRAEYAELQRR